MPLHEQRRELRAPTPRFSVAAVATFGARNGRVEKMLTIIEGN